MYNSNVIYHVYNQSINHELLFRTDDNYRFFLGKLRKHLAGNSEILCYCLMPDHFHLMIKPTEKGCLDSGSKRYRRSEERVSEECAYQQKLSHAFKTILSSYTQAFNKKYGRRGSLFKAHTKAKPGYEAFCETAQLLIGPYPFTLYVPYLRVCFQYIHYNPVKASYVNHPTEWEFSSALDFTGRRNSKLINFATVKNLLGITKGSHFD